MAQWRSSKRVELKIQSFGFVGASPTCVRFFCQKLIYYTNIIKMPIKLSEIASKVTSDGGTLISDNLPDHLPLRYKVPFICKCGKNGIKSVSSIIRHQGALCSSCQNIESNKKSKIKRIAKLEEKGCFIYNKINLKKIIKESKATLISKINESDLNQTTQLNFTCKCGIKRTKKYEKFS